MLLSRLIICRHKHRVDQRTNFLKQVNAAKKAVKVIDRDARMSIEPAVKRPDITRELLNPADRDAKGTCVSNIGPK
jgi:hypothetical protein